MRNWDTLDADKVRILDKHYNAGRSGHRISKIVLHHNGGNLTTEGCVNVWQTREASAHYQVEADGTIGQCVWDSDTAWHAGDWTANCESIGIEHADISSDPWQISDATLDNGAHLTAAICKYYGLGEPEHGVNVFYHNEFTATTCPASIAGSQAQAYLDRAKYWYQVMTGTRVQEDDMPSAQEVAQAVWAFTPPDGNQQPSGNPYETLKTGGQVGGFAFTVDDGEHNNGKTVYWLNTSTMRYRGYGTWNEWETWCKLMHCPTDKYAKLTSDEFNAIRAFLNRSEEKL